MAPEFDALVTAAGRLGPADAERFGADIKALVRIGGATLLETLIGALRRVSQIERIIVVGPAAAQKATDADVWINEQATGEENVFAALRSARSERAIFAASDLPFVSAASIEQLIAQVPASADAAYPIFTRAEFEEAFPGARSSFARLADGQWTGGSVFLLSPAFALRNERVLRRAFAARKNLVALAALLGPGLALRYARNQLRVADIVARAQGLMRGSIVAVRGADPALAMDCDEAADFEYAMARAAGRVDSAAP